MATQKNSVNPLSHNVPIVNKDGTPTPEFMKKWSQQANTNGNIPVALSTAAQVSAVLDLLGLDEGDVLFRGPTEWGVLAPGTAGYVLKTSGAGAAPQWESVTALLDTIGSTKGDILFHDGTNWNVLAVPATDGWVLTYDNTTGLPVWKAGGGGGGALIGTGVPTALEPVGTLYSRIDTPELWQSQPTTIGGAVVQALSNIQGNNVPGVITLGAAPGVGNLIIAYVAWGNVQVAPTINTTDWTVIDIAPDPSGGTNIAGFALYRYVQPGDNANLPALCTAGNSYWAGQFWEIAGVSGVFATDVPVHFTHQAFGNSHTAGPLTTTVAGQIVLLCGGQYDASLNPVTNATGGWTQDSAAANSGNFGNMTGWHQTVSASGTAVSAALTSNAGSPYCLSGVMLAITVSTVTSPGWTKLAPSGGGGGYNPGTPPTIVQIAHDNSGAAPIFAVAPTNGNLLVGMNFNPSSGSPGSGWTQQAFDSGGTDYGFICTKVCGPSESTTQNPVAGTPGTGFTVIWEIAGASAYLIGATQTEHGGISNLPIFFPNSINCLGLWACGATPGGSQLIGNAGTVDVNAAATRLAAAGHGNLGDVPTAGGVVGYSTSCNSKSATCLITA